MKTTKIRYIAIFVLALTFTGCKTAEMTQHDVAKDFPLAYGHRVDSSNAAQLNWEEFFNDSRLLGLIDTALKNNMDMLVAMQRIEASRAHIRRAKGAMLPMVSGIASGAQRKFGLYTMDGAGNATTNIREDELIPVHLPDYYLGLQSSWELDAWGRLRNRKAAALSRYMSSVEGRNLVITNLVSETANAYYELLALDEQLTIIRETIVLQENALALTIVQMETGTANKLAVEQFDAQLIDSKARANEVHQQIIETESRINLLMGRFPQSIPRAENEFLKSAPVRPHVGIPSDLLKYRPDIRQAEYELLAANADIKSARAAFLPSFNITGSYGFQAYKTSFLFTSPESVAYGLIGSLTAPLINRSAIKAKFKVSKAAQLEALYNYQRSALNGYIEVYNELSNLRNLEELYNLRSRQVELLAESVETSSELFSSRRATYLEVILAQRNSLETKLELVEAKKRQFNSVVNLYRALGGGWQ